MCELFGMSSNLPTAVDLSLEAMAQRGGLTGPHDDGWGIAYFHGHDLRLLKEAAPAADSQWVRFIQGHRLHSQAVISHIRWATRGTPAYRNSHPFARELGGHMHVFAHNGTLQATDAEPALRPGRFRPIGETDSEQAFCALLSRLEALWLASAGQPSLEDRLDVVANFAADMRSLGPANFLYGDSDALFVHSHRRSHLDQPPRPPGLVMLQRSCDAGPVAACDGVALNGQAQSILLFASVALSDEAWQPIEEGDVLAVRGGEVVGRRSAADG